MYSRGRYHLQFERQCRHEGEPGETFESLDNGSLTFTSGLPYVKKEILVYQICICWHPTHAWYLAKKLNTLGLIKIDKIQKSNR